MSDLDVDEDDSLALKVTRFALAYDPPTLVVEFRRQGRLFVKKIRIKQRIRDSNKSSRGLDAKALAKSLIKHNHELLNANMVCHDQVGKSSDSVYYTF
jgi:hypothetical protein